MKPLSIPLRAVFYREEGYWVAHCLEFDLVGSGDTREEALGVLSDAIYTQLEATLKNRNWSNLFSPAESKYFTMFAAGRNIAVGTLQFQKLDNVTIEEVQTREYLDADGELVPA